MLLIGNGDTRHTHVTRCDRRKTTPTKTPEEAFQVEYLSEEYYSQNPETLQARDSIELLMILAGQEVISSLTDLLTYTAIAEDSFRHVMLSRRRVGT
jgi:hypothetical protein